jgi:hypothetical protein
MDESRAALLGMQHRAHALLADLVTNLAEGSGGFDMATVAQAVLILAQEGADISPLLAAWQHRADDAPVAVLQQQVGESMVEFKRRLQLRLQSFERTGGAIERGAFVAKHGFGLPDVLATVALLSSLVATMVAFGTGTVYLWGQVDDHQASYALEALADAMRDQVRGTGVQVITEERSSSGVHEIVPAASYARVTSRPRTLA